MTVNTIAIILDIGYALLKSILVKTVAYRKNPVP
jgi:hypothetical protein